MRMIDADALMRKLCVQCDAHFHEATCEPDECFVYNVIVYDAPTIDAEPVRHGTWVEERGVLHSSGRVVTCPLCHKQHFIPSRTISWWVSDETVFQKPDRCRNCGAKMDGGGSNA